MSVSPIVTRGFGSFGSIARVVLRGFLSAVGVVTVTPAARIVFVVAETRFAFVLAESRIIFVV